MPHLRVSLTRALASVAVTALVLGISPGANASPEIVQGAMEAVDGRRVAGPEGAAFRLDGGTEVLLAAGTDARFSGTTDLDLGHGTKKTMLLSLIRGRVDVIAPRGQHGVVVSGPQNVSAVGASGRYTVIATAEGIAIGSLAAKVLTGVGSKWKDLVSGNVRTLSAAGRDEWGSLVAAPAVAMERAIALDVGGKGADVIAMWPRVTGALRYEAELLRADDRAVIAKESVAGEKVVFETLPPGRYAVRARAIDAYGLESEFSREARASIVGLELPRGAVATGHALSIGPRDRVRLLGASGLEMTYGGGKHFVAAPSDVRLAGGRPTLVRLRVPGTQAELSLSLEPRDVRAHIDLGPSDAAWPRDEVTVSLEFVDTAGRPVSRVKPSVEVTVNVEPTTVRWTKKGNVWRGKIPRPRGKGPWVVRVEAKDASDMSIGRSFLEVARGSDGAKAREGSRRAKRAAPQHERRPRL